MIGMSRRGSRNKQYLKNWSQNQNFLQSIPECIPLSVVKSNAHHSEWHMSTDMAMPIKDMFHVSLIFMETNTFRCTTRMTKFHQIPLHLDFCLGFGLCLRRSCLHLAG